MQNVVITSTTDTESQVLEAMGQKQEETQSTANAQADTEESAQKSASPQSEGKDKTPAEASEAADDEQTAPDETDADKTEDDEKPKKDGIQRRIDKLTKQKHEMARELEYWRKEALNKQAQTVESDDEPAQKQSATQDGKPDPNNFESHEEYVEALSEWKVEKKLAEREQKTREAELKNQYEKAKQDFKGRLDSYSEKHDDFMELVESVDDIPMSITVQDTILESEVGPELMHELAKDRENYIRICRLPATSAARELGKIEAKILSAKESAGAKTEKQTTKAPPPIKPLATKSAGVSTKSPDEMSFEEYKAWREKRQTS